MSHPVSDSGDGCVSKFIITHVFCPLQLPACDDHSIQHDRALAGAIATAARLYSAHVSKPNIPSWRRISRMLESVETIVQSQRLDRFQTIFQLDGMEEGDIVALPVRAQNAGVIFRRQTNVTVFESFEMSPRAESVMSAEGKLVCSYPGPAVEIPNAVFEDKDFRYQLVNFLVHMSYDNVHGSGYDAKDTVHPRHITELLTGILRSVGRPADIARISKRVGDDVVYHSGGMQPWRRSALWLLIRVVLQTTLDASPLEHGTYKEFLLFFMCRLAGETVCAELPSDLLQFMATKLCRRLRKLGSSAPVWLTQTVLQTCTFLRSTIETRWKQVQAAQRLSPDWSPSELDLNRDVELSLSNSGDYLRRSLANHDVAPPSTPFRPEHRHRGTLADFLSSDGEYFDEAYRTEPHVALYDFEQAVEQNIDAWIRGVTHNNDACVKLEILAHKYSSSALETYVGNPELLSIMLLTTIELWVALDKIAVKEIPILRDYSPEVPTVLLEHLLLCRAASLERLRRAYGYLAQRHSRSRVGWSVFSSTITVESFAVRFLRHCPRLQNLEAQIKSVARAQELAKVAELREANNRHTEIQLRVTETGLAESNMDKQIAVHEWPLPANQLHAEAVVFELDCPVTFNMWRSATLRLLVDLCSPPPAEKEREAPNVQLGSYKPLESYLVKHPRSRISLGSNMRPSNFTHPDVPLPAQRDQVCIKNRLIFFAFDTRTNVPVSEALGHSDSKAHCTYKLQSGLYQVLQKYVDTAAHTSNDVIANQADCHKDLSIHEYMAFGHVRSGGLIQWLNVLRELRGRSLTFRRPEVHMLLVQAVSQVGPLDNGEWTWHQEVKQPGFCHALLREMENLVRDIEANWMEGVTMDTVSFLVRRLLASSPNNAVSSEAVQLLRTLRAKVLSWIRELLAQLARTPGDDACRAVLRDTAAVCRSTFDLDSVKVPDLLRSAEDVEVLLLCAILIHDHMPVDVSLLPAYSQILLDRDRRLSLALEGVVSRWLQGDATDEGINRAMKKVWPDYRPGSKWHPMPGPNARWFCCTTARTRGQRAQNVHFNVLDGSLLVDGRPLGTWLPNDYLRHSLYKMIFGEEMLTVAQSDLPGMDYLARGAISDYKVYFSLRNNGADLVIRAKPKETETGDVGVVQLIPYEQFVGDLPSVLIEGHAHWLNLSTSVLEIRPLETLWQSSPENWRIDCTPGRCRMWRGHDRLVDIRSRSWDMVSKLLRPLGTPQDLIVSASPTDPGNPSSKVQLSVVLPRYDLSFYVDEDDDLHSRNIRGMVYDENQSIGTLFGLVHQLVLRPKIAEVDIPDLVPRCVLIPDGDISFRREGHHVCVEINPPPFVVRRVSYQVYRVNTDLGCLTGNGSLTSKLYCAYLHALTNGSSADPLTGRSGTEEALSMLRSASCYSNVRSNPRDAELLRMIASLYPSRTWYAKQIVQKVEWRDLPVNSQHHELHLLSKAIKERSDRVQLFHESPSKLSLDDFPSQDEHLLKRSARRAAYVYPFRFSAKPFAENVDDQYSARDRVERDAASGEHRAYTAATCVYRRTATSAKDIWNMVGSWKEKVSGVSGDTTLSLQYDRLWLAPDLPLLWLKTYNLLRESDDRKWFQLLFSLPAMAYASPKESELVPVFVAFAAHSEFRFEDPPHYDSYPIMEGYHPSLVTLNKYVVDCAYPLERSPESMEPAKQGEGIEILLHRQLRMYHDRRRMDADATARELSSAWPCETCPPCSLSPKLYDVADLEAKVQLHFYDCFRNFQLKQHLTRVQTILNDLHAQVTVSHGTVLYAFSPSRKIPPRVPWGFTVDQLFARPAPRLSPHDRLPQNATDVRNASLPDCAQLHQFIDTVETNATNAFQHRYVSALRTSAAAFESDASGVDQKTMGLPATDTLEEHYAWCKSSYTSALQHFKRHLGPKSQSEQIVELSGQWPCFTADALFRCLASNSPISLRDDWKERLTTLALLALEVQRARRLLVLHLDERHEELRKELGNEGCDGWDAGEHPDWLLIQLQCNFLIRRVQADVANQMISPSSGDNTAMQLNMGEGKTSVIVPVVAAVLADGEQLARVIVPKALTAQTLHLLADRLGGLTNRRIYYLPFSRSLEVNDQTVASVREIMLECMRERGVLVVQPEHILSLKLVSVEKQLSRTEDGQVAHKLLELQKWLDAHSRDVLDESDEVLAVRSQLVFTIGHQRFVEGSPERWTTIQQVLALVENHALSLRDLFPHGVECEPGHPGSFPYLRVLHPDAGEELVSRTVQDIVEGRLQNISSGQLRLQLDFREAIRTFISCEDVPPEQSRLVKEYCGQCTPLWNCLLLLRGLLANGILLFVFRERRWRVDYGLAPKRTMLAVPYRAKDVPAHRAEFGHPDIAIILTCLSYYYAGLTEEQLRLSFGILLKQHDAALDYEPWIRACAVVPPSLRSVSGLNIESMEQWNKHLVPLFSRNRATINFYLSKVVFPREANEFPSKLSSSGWDLAEKRQRLVTGFSGTNDGQYLFPLHITQCDPDHQRGTNAKVLSYLLQLENNYYVRMAGENGGRTATREFLRTLVDQRPEIRVLLDVGAQMLDLDNHGLAKSWLDLAPTVSAAIYFNEFDELTVCTRDGDIQPFLSSPYAEQLDRCVIYLDDAHTRGTDIRFPNGFRAAVTLGPRVTKDRLVQGCMRMRRLGHGHSVMFFAPFEVDWRICAMSGKDRNSSNTITTANILHWAVRETWENVQRWAPQCIQQGIDHTSRYSAWSDFCNGLLGSEGLSKDWLQPAGKKLEDLYEPHNSSGSGLPSSLDIPQHFIDLGIQSLSSDSVDEEQERELVHDVKRQADRPSSVPPAIHSIHHDVLNFVKSGVMPTHSKLFTKLAGFVGAFRTWSKGFSPAFETLRTTSATMEEAYVWSQSVLVTTDFERTVDISQNTDDYLRPVHWVVSAKRATAHDWLVVLSPYEVNRLLPDIRSSKKVTVHLYAPRITKSMVPCDDLGLYSVPAVSHRWTPPSAFMDQLNMFAGQTYLKDYESYLRLCRFLCVYARDLEGELGVRVEPDGFIKPVNRPHPDHSQALVPHTFSVSPVASLRALMDLRSKGTDFASTHMGRLLRGQLLSEDDFEG